MGIRDSRSSRGSAMAQLMVTAVVGVIVTLVITKLSLRTVSVGKRANDQATLRQYQAELTAFNKDVTRLLKAWRDPAMASITGEVAACIPESGTPNCQPAEAIADDIVRKRTAGLTVRSVRLSDALQKGALPGSAVAGTESSPMFFNADGAACTGGATHPQCRFRAIAYMIRQFASGDPGNVQFIVKFERNPSTKLADENLIAPAYILIDIGTRWRAPDSPSSCSGILGFDDGGDPLCYGAPNCGAGQHFVGWNDSGAPQCVGDLQPDCTANEGVSGFDANGMRICKPVVNAGQWSGCTVACGGGVATTCTYPFPNPAIPNDGACAKAPPACNTGSCTCSDTSPTCWSAWSGCTGGNCMLSGNNRRRCRATPPMTCTDPQNLAPLKTVKGPNIPGTKIPTTQIVQDIPCDFKATNPWTGQYRSFPIQWAASPCCGPNACWYDIAGCVYWNGSTFVYPFPGTPGNSADLCKYGAIPTSQLYRFGPGVFLYNGQKVPNSP